jgi:uncharacterized caspase-like protein
MDEYDRRRDDLLVELARRFRDSSGTMQNIAQRIQSVARADGDARRRFARASQSLRESVEAPDAAVPFSYLEFLEFDSADEFRRFQKEPVVTDADIERVDWDDLLRRLQD